MEKNCYSKIKYPFIARDTNEWSFAFRYEFFKHLEPFLLSGLLTDYISIKLIRSNTIAVLSTKPAVELNIINSNLFFYDSSYSIDRFLSQQPLLWSEAFSSDKFFELKYKKMDLFGFTSAISLYAGDQDKMISVSFATSTNKQEIDEYYLSNIDYLSKIAHVVEKISLPMFNQIFGLNLGSHCFTKHDLQLKSKVFLAVNNTKNLYE